MVNTISHLDVGILIASVLGIKGKQRWRIGLIVAIPDLDIITGLIFVIITDTSSVSQSTSNQLFYLLSHRGFTHSLVFALLIIPVLWVWKKALSLVLNNPCDEG